MLLQIISIYDAALGAYMQPSFVASNGVALRSFSDLVNNPQSEISKHPEDYALYALGTFNDVDGEFFVEQPKVLVKAKDLVVSK